MGSPEPPEPDERPDLADEEAEGAGDENGEETAEGRRAYGLNDRVLGDQRFMVTDSEISGVFGSGRWTGFVSAERDGLHGSAARD